MPEFVEVPGGSDLKSGEMKIYNIGGHEVLLARVGAKYYATDNRCPHLGGELSKGKLENTIVTCPRHSSRFDLKDGHVVRWTDFSGVKLSVVKIAKPPRPLKVYATKVEGDKVWIDKSAIPG